MSPASVVHGGRQVGESGELPQDGGGGGYWTPRFALLAVSQVKVSYVKSELRLSLLAVSQVMMLREG